jgi:hypothetical protein
MPAAKPDGYAVQRIAGDLEDYILGSGDKLADIITDLLDGDDDTSEALRNAVALVQDNARLLHIVTLIARKDFASAETEAMRLVASANGART